MRFDAMALMRAQKPAVRVRGRGLSRLLCDESRFSANHLPSNGDLALVSDDYQVNMGLLELWAVWLPSQRFVWLLL